MLNKLRFALPTVGIARAFDVEAKFLSERPYRNYKVKMLNWELCRSLIIGPPAIANRVRGSAAAVELFIKAVSDIKHLMISRKEANKELRAAAMSSSEDEEKENSPPPAKRSKLEMLEEKLI